METITIEIIREYLKINKHGLNATQNTICVPVINRIYRKMKYGIKFDEIKVCEHLIIEGHHRYVSALLAGTPMRSVATHKTRATTECDWNEIEIVNDEWDTTEKIKKLNQEDADFNNIPLSEIINILK